MIRGRQKLSHIHSSEPLPVKTWLFLGLLAFVVALTGGASRYDALQIVPLRVLSTLLLMPALYHLSLRDLRRDSVLVSLFGLFVGLVAVQLLPLPPEVWQELPGRGDIFRFDTALLSNGIWRPLTLTPMRTWNAIGSLVVPASALVIAIAFGATSRSLLQVIAALGVLNAILGLLQIVTGRSSVFYLYDLTNRGSAVGIFANENHAAIFAACSLLILATLWLRSRDDPRAKWLNLVYLSAFCLLFLTSLIGNSRAGFAAAIGAMVASIGMLLLSPPSRKRRSSGGSFHRFVDAYPRLLILFPVVIIVLLISAFLLLDRTPAFRDILSRDNLVDLRWLLWPVIGEMIKSHWLFGAGFGSFEQIYHIYEPSTLLMPQYVNQAHNDWAQLLIEGGVFAALLVAGLLAWIVRSITQLVMAPPTRINALFWVSIFLLIAVASTIDYPLRTPLFQVAAVWLLVALSADARDAKAT